MIKFKEFNVGDADYKEQMEQFQTEHQNAEFVQITGGHMSYEKIWFKYETSDTSVTTDKLSVEKLQEELESCIQTLITISILTNLIILLIMQNKLINQQHAWNLSGRIEIHSKTMLMLK